MKIRPLLQLSAAFLLGAGVIYTLMDLNTEELLGTTDNRLPQAILMNAQATRTNEQGQLVHRMNAVVVRHYPTPERYEAEQPVLITYEQGTPQWRVTSQSATAGARDESVILTGNVRAVRGNDVVIRTDRLVANQAQDRIHTNRPVLITGPLGVMKAQGLEAHLSRRDLTLHGQVEAQYAPAR